MWEPAVRSSLESLNVNNRLLKPVVVVVPWFVVLFVVVVVVVDIVRYADSVTFMGIFLFFFVF